MNVKFDSPEELSMAIDAAAEAHHKFESQVLLGERDESWANWYADYMVYRYGGGYHFAHHPGTDGEAYNFAARMAAEREHAKNEEAEANLVAEYDDSASWDVVGPQPTTLPLAGTRVIAYQNTPHDQNEKRAAANPVDQDGNQIGSDDGGLAHRKGMAF